MKRNQVPQAARISQSVVVPIQKDDLANWTQTLKISRHPAQQAIFYKGHLPYGVLVLESGTISMTRGARPGGRSVRHAGPCLIGVSQVLKNRPYPCTGFTQTECAIYFIPKSLLEEWLRAGRRLPHLPPLRRVA